MFFYFQKYGDAATHFISPADETTEGRIEMFLSIKLDRNITPRKPKTPMFRNMSRTTSRNPSRNPSRHGSKRPSKSKEEKAMKKEQSAEIDGSLIFFRFWSDF